MNTGKRKQSNWFSNNHKKRKNLALEAGIKGFLCTCNSREKDCIRDVYKLLNEFSDKLSEVDESKVPETVAENENVDDEDISGALSKEVDKLQEENAKSIEDKKFQALETGVKNTVFIKTTVPDPLRLVMPIVKEVSETKKQRSRFLLRFLPVEIVCKAFMDDLKSKADPILEKYFAQEPKTFSIVFNRHSNNNLQRNEVIEELAEIITKKNPSNRVDLKNPEIAVVVEVIRGFCLLCIAPNYLSYKKYNLLEMCNPTQQKKEQQDVGNVKKVGNSKNDENDAKSKKSENELNEPVPDAVSSEIKESVETK